MTPCKVCLPAVMFSRFTVKHVLEIGMVLGNEDNLYDVVAEGGGCHIITNMKLY